MCKAPCFKCDDRSTGCKMVCDLWQEYEKRHAEERDARMKAKGLENAFRRLEMQRHLEQGR